MRNLKEKKTVLLVLWPFAAKIAAPALLTLVSIIAGNIYFSVLFGLITAIFGYPLYNPNIRIVFIGTKGYQKYLHEDFKNKLKNYKEEPDEPGIFSYSDNGFDITLNNQTDHYCWGHIICMVAYKIDNFTTDCICLDVFCDNNKRLSITEETKGWYLFTRKTKEQFPQINKLWTLEITTPAFKTNLTLVYDRDGRTLDEVMKIHYPQKM